jgi:thiamine pyrophosphate-dependent acetolactate synthase large subunit-like protein
MKESRDNSLVIQRGDEGGELTWGSDIIADVLRALEYEYVAVCPGSSFRGLHESIVNHLSNHTPEMLLCLHEEHAVAMAHGFAKVCGRPMPVILHCNVGLMHASMAIFNAWCDRMPVVVLAGSGPVDSIKRRTPVDWLHASIDQASIVRDYTKWDDLPLCPEGAVESILRAHQIAQTAPQGPTVVTLDQRMQEELFQGQGTPPDVARFKAPAPASLLIHQPN